MKIFIGLAFLCILGALAAAGVFMLRRPPAEPGSTGSASDTAPRKHMARALAVRVGVSVTLFLIILLSWKLGWIRPTGLPLAQ